jgi:uncharacterized protein (TIGR02246 family)
MRPMSARTSRAARVAAMPLVAAAVLSSACSDQPAATAPIGVRPVAVSAQPVSSSISTDPITDIVTAVTAAWTAKDASAYAAPYAEDVQVINPLGVSLTGREPLRAQHAFLFAGPFAGSTQTIEVRDIQFLTGTIAIVYQDVSLTGYASLPPGLPSSGGVVRTRVTWVVEKRGGSWEIVFQQMTPRL